MTDLEKLLAEATPWPWRICEATIHGRKYGGCWVEGPETDDGDGRPRGMLIPISGSGGAMSYTTRVIEAQGHDHNDANARLIALAPQLAAALIEALEALDYSANTLEILECDDEAKQLRATLARIDTLTERA